MLRIICTAILALVLLTGSGRAQDLRFGYRTQPTSLDPHYHNATPSIQVAMHVFNSLVTQTGTDRLDPGLAISWASIEPNTWEFKLRPNVRFSDGTPFTAADVVFTFQRVRTVQTPMGGFVNYLGPVAGVEAVDDTTLRVHTVAPTPLLPNYMSRIFILSHIIHANAATEDFNSGKAMIGTGPYRLTRLSGIDNLSFERKTDYWGKPPIWQQVTSRVIGNDAARLAALLSGDVDVIETVPTQDAARLMKDPRATVSSAVSQRVMYFWFDWLNPGPSPNYSDNDGHPLARSPFLDIRVRQAFSKAIDRYALIGRLMDGFAVPAAQFVRDGQFGYTLDITPPSYDPEGARRLLAEAGFPHGFRLTIHGPADRWNNDGKVVATVAQMLTRVGITVQAEALPFSIYVPRESKGDFSFHLSGAGSWTGEVGAALVDTVLTQDRTRGWGAVNRGRYNNPALDALVGEAVHTLDGPARKDMLIRASKTVAQELPLVMLYQEMNIWAARKGLKYIARNDERTVAVNTIVDAE
jgi:peptide/nickel transport system substrate-binding protein